MTKQEAEVEVKTEENYGKNGNNFIKLIFK